MRIYIYIPVYINHFKHKYCKQHIQQATLANAQQTLQESSISYTISTSAKHPRMLSMSIMIIVHLLDHILYIPTCL